ncbi:MAG: ABC transporter ATP-binding protein [Actinomycetota bacterium]|nr:MAG: ABC transporter ATP-binding protein [Actinomycetota bacterium]
MKSVESVQPSQGRSVDSDTVLATFDLVVRYGAVVALDGVSIHVRKGEMVALIGPNGAGKSTLLNTLSGINRPASGRIVRKGKLAHVPEGRQVFPDLTVEDNLCLGAYRGGSRNPAPMYELFPQLEKLRYRRAGGLSGGEQQMVAICRALMANPDVIAVDELSQGLAPLVVSDIARHLVELNKQHGTAVLLVEQNAQLALNITSRAYVIENGHIGLEGRSSDLLRNPAVRAAYLGGVR